MTQAEETLRLATKVSACLAKRQIRSLLIGALALASRGYPRFTEDVDLAIAVDPRSLPGLSGELAKLGLSVVLSEADGNDPLGGVLTICEEGALPVQVINFDNSPGGGFPALVKDALGRSERLAASQLLLPLSEDLILFKLYAGGPKSELDILELMTRAPVDLGQLMHLAEGYGMGVQLSALLQKVPS